MIRLEQLIAESGSAKDMRPLIAEAIDLALFIVRENGQCKLKEMITVDGFEHGAFRIAALDELPN